MPGSPQLDPSVGVDGWVKAGAEGAAWVTGDRVISLGPHPVSRVVDPTGAGDALAGGFLGACARHRCAAPDSIAEIALHEGLSCASRAISTFGATGLRRGAPRHRVARPGVPPSSQSEIAETAIT
jgi:sugar/nucleoside kinase (ribokinase family)